MGEIEAFWSNEERLTLHKTVGKFHFSTMVKTLNMRQTGTQEAAAQWENLICHAL